MKGASRIKYQTGGIKISAMWKDWTRGAQRFLLTEGGDLGHV